MVVTPTGALPLAEVCKKDVPFNVPYLILQDQEVPVDRTFRNAWDADFSNPDGYGLGARRWFIEKAEHEIFRIQGLPETDDPVEQQQRKNAIAKNVALIAQMKEEIFEIEGVRL